ncbi:unnamed protein product, partial [Discosporangium mesarthrocarpum]
MVLRVDVQGVTPEALCQLFGLYGDVQKVKLVYPRGMALVQMKYPLQAVNAQRLLDQVPLCGMNLEVRPSNQWTINDPKATDFTKAQGLHRYHSVPTPDDARYCESLAIPCPTLVLDNVSPSCSAEELISLLEKYGPVSSVDLDTHATSQASSEAKARVGAGTGGGGLTTAGEEDRYDDPKLQQARGGAPPMQALAHMEGNHLMGALEGAVH